MTSKSYAIRADRLPEGLCVIYAHGTVPGGLAYVDQPGQHLYGLTGPMWSIRGDDLADFEGVPLTPIPTETAAASTDPRVRAYVKEN